MSQLVEVNVDNVNGSLLGERAVYGHPPAFNNAITHQYVRDGGGGYAATDARAPMPNGTAAVAAVGGPSAGPHAYPSMPTGVASPLEAANDSVPCVSQQPLLLHFVRSPNNSPLEFPTNPLLQFVQPTAAPPIVVDNGSGPSSGQWRRQMGDAKEKTLEYGLHWPHIKRVPTKELLCPRLRPQRVRLHWRVLLQQHAEGMRPATRRVRHFVRC